MSNRIMIKDRNGKVRECSKIEGLSISFETNTDNNKVIISEPYSFEGSVLFINGSENSFEIGEASQINRLRCMIAGKSNSVRIGQKCEIRDVRIVMSNVAEGRKLDIGKYFSFFGGDFHIVSKNNVLTIGDNCLFSSAIDISTEDGHPVYDIYEKRMSNKGGKLVIGNNVWLGYNCTICKNGSINDNVIVGACSLVTKPIRESNCIVVGEPAQVIKRGVGFSKLTIESYLRSHGEI